MSAANPIDQQQEKQQSIPAQNSPPSPMPPLGLSPTLSEHQFGAEITGIGSFVKCKPPTHARKRISYGRRFQSEDEPDLVPIQPIIEAHSDREQLRRVVQKLRQCQKLFNFNDPAIQYNSKVVKSAALNELIDFFSGKAEAVSDRIYSEVAKTVAKNAFRALPPTELDFAFDDIDFPSHFETEWPHLELVYDLFYRFLQLPSFEVSSAKRYIDQRFVLNLLQMFETGDSRELSSLTNILHAIYEKLPGLRSFIRRQFKYIFLSFVFDSGTFGGRFANSIAHMLVIVASIITGFALPLREEHKEFCLRVLIPLHRSRLLKLYQSQLMSCIAEFIVKDSAMAPKVFVALLRCWPRCSAVKEASLLQEIGEFLTIMEPVQFNEIAILLFKQLSQCASSPHFQVVDQTMALWSNEYVQFLISGAYRQVVSLMLPPLYRIVREEHWNRSLIAPALTLLNSLLEMDGRLFTELSEEYHNKEDTRDSPKRGRLDMHNLLESLRSPPKDDEERKSEWNGCAAEEMTALDQDSSWDEIKKEDPNTNGKIVAD